ncbi:MAG: HAD family hydrolase [Pseudomonadota bacterium]|nr:HAD family hydrolase [Pseudomonadota bacterium]
MALKGVLLDIDGTLLDSNAAHALAWQAALRRHGHDTDFDTLRRLIGKGGDKVLMEVARLDIGTPLGEAITAARREDFKRNRLHGLRPFEGTRALLERFVSDGLALVVATSSSKEELGPLLEQAGVDDLITCSATSDDARHSKPDPDIVQAALEKAGLRPGEVILLGDTPYDIDAAAAAGVATVALRGDRWWNDDALRGAVAIYDHPGHLLRELATLAPYRLN